MALDDSSDDALIPSHEDPNHDIFTSLRSLKVPGNKLPSQLRSECVKDDFLESGELKHLLNSNGSLCEGLYVHLINDNFPTAFMFFIWCLKLRDITAINFSKMKGDIAIIQAKLWQSDEIVILSKGEQFSSLMYDSKNAFSPRFGNPDFTHQLVAIASISQLKPTDSYYNCFINCDINSVMVVTSNSGDVRILSAILMNAKKKNMTMVAIIDNRVMHLSGHGYRVLTEINGQTIMVRNVETDYLPACGVPACLQMTLTCIYAKDDELVESFKVFKHMKLNEQQLLQEFNKYNINGGDGGSSLDSNTLEKYVINLVKRCKSQSDCEPDCYISTQNKDFILQTIPTVTNIWKISSIIINLINFIPSDIIGRGIVVHPGRVFCYVNLKKLCTTEHDAEKFIYEVFTAFLQVVKNEFVLMVAIMQHSVDICLNMNRKCDIAYFKQFQRTLFYYYKFIAKSNTVVEIECIIKSAGKMLGIEKSQLYELFKVRCISIKNIVDDHDGKSFDAESIHNLSGSAIYAGASTYWDYSSIVELNTPSESPKKRLKMPAVCRTKRISMGQKRDQA